LAKKGLPKWAIEEARKRGAKNIFAYAWSLVKRKRSPTKTKKRSVRNVAKRKTKRRRSFTIPLAPIIGFAAAPDVRKGFEAATKGDWGNSLKFFGQVIGVGADGRFRFDLLKNNMFPIIVGLLVHKFVGGRPLNLNQVLARSGIPLVRI